jgi:hypothetical protein
MSKPKMRARLASLSFSEKIQILEKLRDRSATIAASGLRRKTGVKQPKTIDLTQAHIQQNE